MAVRRFSAERLMSGIDPTLDHVALRRQAAELLRRSFGFDLAVWATVDPATIMWTSCVLDGMPRDESLETEIFANEYGQDDVLKLADLADGPKIGALCVATGGDVLSSPRFRDVLRTRGFSDELRMLFHDGESNWGALCLYRTAGHFDRSELTALSRLGRPFGEALRTALVRDRAELTTPGTTADAAAGAAAVSAADPVTGIIVTRPDGRIVEISDEARALLGGRTTTVDEPADGPAVDRATPAPGGHGDPADLIELPQVVQAVVARHAAGGPASATAPTRDGRWLTFHATSLGGNRAVVVEQVRPHRLAELLVRSRGLTARERQVLECVARGRSNRQIARILALSEYTVQDHIKAIFVKFGVASRNELVAALFFGHYAAMHATDTTA